MQRPLCGCNDWDTCSRLSLYTRRSTAHTLTLRFQGILQLLNPGLKFLLTFFYKMQGHGRYLNQLLSGLARPSNCPHDKARHCGIIWEKSSLTEKVQTGSWECWEDMYSFFQEQFIILAHNLFLVLNLWWRWPVSLNHSVWFISFR